MAEQLIIDSLEKAFSSLAETIKALEDDVWFNQQQPIIQDTLIAGTIQKFEFVYELSLKMIKRQLKQMAISDDEIEAEHFRDILRDAAKYGLIESVEQWIAYRKMRNITSHTYDQYKALEIYNGIADFLESSQYLLQQLRKWNNPNDR